MMRYAFLGLFAVMIAAGCSSSGESKGTTSSTTGAGGGGTTSSTGQGGSGQGGSAATTSGAGGQGGGAACIKCNDVISNGGNPADLCAASADLFKALQTCNCTTCAAGCQSNVCAGNPPPSSDCQSCIDSMCKSQQDACLADK